MRQRSPAGFTLIELLVVVTIVSLLMAILMPALAKARDRARTMACMSNLHTQALLLANYAVDNRDYLPVGLRFSPPTSLNWTVTFRDMIVNKSGVTPGSTSATRAFLCPTAAQASPPEAAGAHYSCHPFLMPNITPPSPFPLYKTSSQRMPSKTLIIVDGVQQLNIPDYTVNATAYRLDFGSTLYYNAGSADLMNLINPGPNVDSNATPGAVGNIRWRHASNTAAAMLMLDGHADVRKPNQVRYENVRHFQ